KVLPLVVTVTGRVGSETPVNCEQSGLRGVIVEETVHILSSSNVEHSLDSIFPSWLFC
ncbi:hypothetical protein BHE74_00029447, partial [Ensete ventricosum]